MLDGEKRSQAVKDFIKRSRFKWPVFEISALTREGCEPLIRAVYQFIEGVRTAGQPPQEIDPRFAPDSSGGSA
jgi:GTP-binding protein